MSAMESYFVAPTSSLGSRLLLFLFLALCCNRLGQALSEASASSVEHAGSSAAEKAHRALKSSAALSLRDDVLNVTFNIQALARDEFGLRHLHLLSFLFEDPSNSSSTSIHTWPPFVFDGKVLIATVLGCLASALASGGGVGGGGLFVPLFNLVLTFDAKTSTALSKSMVFGGALTGYLQNINAKHPKAKNRPLINYDIALLLQPMLLLGISVGVICNVIFPAWIIVVGLTVILSYMTYRSSKAGMTMWKKETAAENEGRIVRRILHDAGDESVDGAVDGPGASAVGAAIEVGGSLDDLGQPLLLQEKEVEKVETEPQLPMSKILQLFLFWCSIFTLQAVKEWTDAPCAGVVYWVLTLAQIPLALGMTTFTALRLLREKSERASAVTLEDANSASEAYSGDAAWGEWEITLYPLVSLLAGVMGGLLGIGGGMVVSPMLLDIGVLPQVTAATTAFMVLFSSSLSVAEFAMLKRLPFDFACYFAIVSFISSFMGLTVLQSAVRKHGRPSIIVFTVASILAVSVICMASFGTFDAYRRYLEGETLGFHPLCTTT
eukprot:TRINITY_DN12074_c0_g1_i2.p1 TRINITY_DN12074_c0_g1~~TRINITY_DN12074_c0_g1_i2.p1  ORF type:complete len:551 (+),score=108.67 TRINITY_DN12074_c0_g1_i2:195-1847(+)